MMSSPTPGKEDLCDDFGWLNSLPTDFQEFSMQSPHSAKPPAYEQQRQFKTRMCHYGASCPYGPKRCYFAHSESELRLPSARWWIAEYKTKPCRYSLAECPFAADGRCQFAHDVSELKTSRTDQPANFKTRMCKYAATGNCPYEGACSYAHSVSELRTRPERPA